MLYKTKGKKYAKAEPRFVEAKEITRAALGDEAHPMYGVLLGHLAVLYAEKGELAKAEPLLVEIWWWKWKTFWGHRGTRHHHRRRRRL